MFVNRRQILLQAILAAVNEFGHALTERNLARNRVFMEAINGVNLVAILVIESNISKWPIAITNIFHD
jgi:Zn-dependent M32 family carboxypeptidase